MVNCGHVYFLYLPIAQKEKLVVPAFVAPDGKVRFFVINTNRTEFQITKAVVAAHVLPVSLNGHEGFLDHDSWLTCHEVVGGYTVSQIDALPNCYRAPLTQEVITAVRQVIQESRLYSEQDKVTILAQWPGT